MSYLKWPFLHERIHMNRLFRRWWMLVAALVTAVAVVVAGTVPAFAAEPGESSSWSNEIVNNNSPIQSPDTYSEARGGQTNALVQIFRGEDNHVWLAVNNGPVFNAGGGNNTTTTYVAPRVVYSNGWFYAFQTGTNNQIYWSRAYDGTIGANTPSVSQSYNWSNWTAITGNPATEQSVSVAAAPTGLLMTWLGVDQTAMYSAWLPAGNDTFNATQVIPYHSNSAPVVAFNSWDNVFQLVYRGLLDNQVYLAEQILGQSTWYDDGALTGLTTPTSPTIAADPTNGSVLVAAIDMDANIWFQAITPADGPRGWSRESTEEQTDVALWLSVVSSIFYVIATASSLGGTVQWKEAWNGD
jgi:hypothetical protein